MTAVPGSLFRRILFWTHLTSGVVAGVFIFIMSATGVLLTYEHQMVEAASRDSHVVVPAGATPMDADRLAQIARETSPPGTKPSLVFLADPAAPVTVTRGRDSATLLNPYDGSVLEDTSAGEREFFRVVENTHRWLTGDSRGTGAMLIDWSNLLFLFLIASGIYIWLPAVWRWRTVRGLLLFQKKYISARMRDFNWHHVFSFWMLIPLAVISLSGVVISFDWANRALFAVYGEAAPQRGGPPGGARAGAEPLPAADPASPTVSLESLRQAAAGLTPQWNRLTLPVNIDTPEVDVVAELKSDERRAPRQTVTLSTADASVIRMQAPSVAPTTPAQRARTWMRFAHTGEEYGLIGQTIAGIASLAACFLIYTGLALAWRRLIRPLFRRATPA